jgi:hypothetical protein
MELFFPTEVLQALHDSEINGRVSWFFDGQIDWELGDDLNGWKAKGQEGTIEAAVIALAASAIEHYPDSDFVRWWREYYPIPTPEDAARLREKRDEGKANGAAGALDIEKIIAAGRKKLRR